ncbi:MAG: ribose-phosphate diphosphokinase, partial [Myxococcota bacterium]
HIVGDVKDKVAIVVDDMVDTAGTLTKGGVAVKEAGAQRVFAVTTHPVLSGPAVSRLEDSVYDRIVVTDSIPLSPEAAQMKNIKVLTVASLFAEAIRAIHFNDSISRLFLPADDL